MRTYDLRVRLTPTERAKLEQKAKAAGYENQSAYVRALIFEKHGVHDKLNRILRVLQASDSRYKPTEPRTWQTVRQPRYYRRPSK